MVWESANIPGEGAGSPKISNDGRHVVATHNLDQRGHFSVFDLESSNSTPIYQYESELVVFAETTPFSAIGYVSNLILFMNFAVSEPSLNHAPFPKQHKRRVYHSPIEGNYDSDSNFGRSNSNDIFVFMTDTNTDVLNPVGEPRAGNGQMYVFQFPVDYFTTQDTSSLAVLPIGNVRNYQARTAPVLANAGQSLYWSMVRGEFRGWVDQRFSRGHTETINFGRGDPAYIAARASPTMSANEEFVYGPGSSNLVFKADRNLVNFTTVATDGIVSSRVAVTLDDQFVVYGTQSGSLAVLVAETMTTKWSTSALNPVKGDLAVDEYRIFVGDDGGNSVGQIVAYEMAYLDQEVSTTTSPSAADRTTGAPSPGPLMDGTAAPTTLVATTTTAPVATTTHAPSLEPTRLSLLESTFKPSAIEATPTTTLAPSRTANVIGGTSGGVAFSFDMNMATMTAVTWVTALVLLW